MWLHVMVGPLLSRLVLIRSNNETAKAPTSFAMEPSLEGASQVVMMAMYLFLKSKSHPNPILFLPHNSQVISATCSLLNQIYLPFSILYGLLFQLFLFIYFFTFIIIRDIPFPHSCSSLHLLTLFINPSNPFSLFSLDPITPFCFSRKIKLQTIKQTFH